MHIALKGVEVRLPAAPSPLFHLPRFDVATGARTLVHGPSGRGKTTLLNLLSGQFTPQAGSIRVGGTELTSLGADARARFRRAHFGIVFQRWNLIDHLTLLENVVLGIPDRAARGAERKRRRAEEALRRVGLAALAARRAGLVSPGEQQRAAVARVSAAEPAIILADEPTSHLDDDGAAHVIDALWSASAGRTLIVVSHDPRLRARFEDARDFSALVSASGSPDVSGSSGSSGGDDPHGDGSRRGIAAQDPGGARGETP